MLIVEVVFDQLFEFSDLASGLRRNIRPAKQWHCVSMNLDSKDGHDPGELTSLFDRGARTSKVQEEVNMVEKGGRLSTS